MNIYAGNLPRRATKDDLRQVFAAFGRAESAKIVNDKVSGESRGYGFVSMPAKAEAEKAIEEMNGNGLMGHVISVEQGQPKTNHYRKDRGGGRGGFGGRGRGGRRY